MIVRLMYHHRVDICVVVSLPAEKTVTVTPVLNVVADERLAANDLADVKPHGNLNADQHFHGRVFRRIRQKTPCDN